MRHRKVIEQVCLALRLVRRWFPSSAVIQVGDGAYAVVELIGFLPLSCPNLPQPHQKIETRMCLTQITLPATQKSSESDFLSLEQHRVA